MERAKSNIIIYISVILLALGLLSGVLTDVSSAADDQNEGGSYVRSLQLLGRAAADFAVLMDEAADKVINPPITRREVYEIEPCERIKRKELRRRGGPDRYFQIYKIRKDDPVYRQIAGRSFRTDGSVRLDDLRYIRTLYHDFNGKVRTGELIVNKEIAKDTLEVFRELYEAKYQIRKMQLVDNYFRDSKTAPVWSSAAAEAADTASMNDDNTSGFNYRMVAGTSRLSRHGYGRAIDVNPFENPWCPGGRVYANQRASASYANRSQKQDHMIFADSDITKIFKKHGFRWLGETATRDYQHFEK